MNAPDRWDSSQQLDALVKTRAAKDGRETTVWWTGDVYTWAPGERNAHVFGFEGLNVSRAVAVEGGYDLLGRECAFYLDPADRSILSQWQPPAGDPVEVVHIWNDPVNQRWRLDGPRGPFRVPITALGPDRVCFNMDIPLAYPSPLPVAQFPRHSADDTYRALELFQFFAPLAELEDPDCGSAACELSWVRMSPWLPWMAQGDRPGGLLFHCRGYKLDSYDQVPERTRGYIAEHQPQYAHAPEQWSEPNESSWTYFRALVESGQYPIEQLENS